MILAIFKDRSDLIMRKRNNEGNKKEEHRTGAVLRLMKVFILFLLILQLFAPAQGVCYRSKDVKLPYAQANGTENQTITERLVIQWTETTEK